ncbi:MAG: glucosamine--fructose-6-phosphate aminotransferase [Gammaproteobacteria bacterium]
MPDDDSPRLPAAVRDWGTEYFEQTLKDEIEALDAAWLPLFTGTRQGGRVDAADIAATVLGSCAHEQTIQARVGVFFSEVVGGCSCGDEPFLQPAYCLLLVTIEKRTAQAGFAVIEETVQGSI